MRGDACGIHSLKSIPHATSWSKSLHTSAPRGSLASQVAAYRGRPCPGTCNLSSLSLPTSRKLYIVLHNIAHFVHLAAEPRMPPSYLPRAVTPHPQLSTLHMDPGSASVTLFPEVYGLEGVVESKWGFLFASLSGIQCSYETCVWSPSSDACGHTLHCSNSTATLHLV